MSDGPHKSLEMSRHWKRVAERVYIGAYGVEEIGEALATALREDWRQQIPEGLVNRVRAVLSNGQAGLFGNQHVQDLEALRADTFGDTLTYMFLDYAVQAAENGTWGEAPLLQLARDVAAEAAARGLRQVQEHLLRESPRGGISHVKERNQEVLESLDFEAIACQFHGVGTSERPKVITKHSGLDEGVALR